MIFCQIDKGLIDIITKYADGKHIVDVGCGDGMLGLLLKDITSIDIRYNESCYLEPDRITIMDATYYHYTDNMFPVFLRPCHSDHFVDRVLRSIKNNGVRNCLYVSKPDNLEIDIDLEQYEVKQIKNWTGLEEEKAYLIKM